MNALLVILLALALMLVLWAIARIDRQQKDVLKGIGSLRKAIKESREKAHGDIVLELDRQLTESGRQLIEAMVKTPAAPAENCVPAKPKVNRQPQPRVNGKFVKR
ncbi:hypothetical protein [Tautonia plasticadhaerens]|uniref:Uncharacterized protein n=1 Tax=Tautonia plasticadhaerens TaxID=2527974 RepID=A0A518H259_9BACT|nr:hypothetical protein [Tautonia plasticadhaerens]QDV34925.1 hypothetical protein ElP_28220 [Tautonia plasticadhaerens]